MGISDLYESNAHRKNLSHFANIVKLALVDEVITKEEQELIDIFADRLNIEKDEYKKIMKDPNIYPINPPISYNERIERLYNLTRIIFIDGEIIGDEVDLLQRLAAGLGFPAEKVEKICEKAIHLIINNYPLDDFMDAIKKLK